MSHAVWVDIERRARVARSIGKSRIDLLDTLLELEFGSEDPFFLQVGANDGMKDDQLSRYVREKRWRGILVEPQPDVFERLKANYSGHSQLIFENVAIGEGKKSLKLYRLAAPEEVIHRVDGVTTSDRNRLEAARTKFGWNYPIEELRVPMVTITDLLKRHRVKDMGLLVIDTEGMDYEVLCSLDFNVYRPCIIQFEHIHLSEERLTSTLSLLRENGYLFGLAGRDVVALRRP